MKIHSNTSAIIANNALTNNDKRLSLSIERLSSGYKINHAKDNPAGLALSKKMRAQIRGLDNASQNANDGISVVETAEGALAEIQEILQRMNELSVKGANGPMTDGDRVAIQEEIDQLKSEVSRIARDTEFNGSTLLDGTYDLKGYTNNTDIKVESYSDVAGLGVYTINEIHVVRDADGNLTDATTVDLDTTKPRPNGEQPFPPVTTTSVEGNTLTVKGEGGFELKLDIREGIASGTTVTDLEVDLMGIGNMRLQIGANEGQMLGVRIPKVSLKTLGIEDTSFSTFDECQDALGKMPGALAAISSVRSRLGAYQNRLEHTTSSLDVSSENMNAALSRIMDTDMATEMTEYTKNQVLVQAGTSMLAQANERPAQVLQLLQ